MILNVKYFGSIADVTKVKEEQLHFKSKSNSLHLIKAELEKKYPEVKNIFYSFAVNQSIANPDAIVYNNDELALLPPFAGG